MDWCQRNSRELGTSFDSDIKVEERILSPSDFGFHNALRAKDGRIVFFDFEYFGWDDPAKTISDFLLHPAMSLNEESKRRFVQGMISAFSENKQLMTRVELVYPLFASKWCLIFLNEFISEEFSRRAYAIESVLDKKQLQKEQLNKARIFLEKIKGQYQSFPYNICAHGNF